MLAITRHEVALATIPAFLVLVGAVVVPFITDYLTRKRDATAELRSAIATYGAVARSARTAVQRNWLTPPEVAGIGNTSTSETVDRFRLVHDLHVAEARVATACPTVADDVRAISAMLEGYITGAGGDVPLADLDGLLDTLRRRVPLK